MTYSNLTDFLHQKTRNIEELHQIISNVDKHRDPLVRELGGIQSAIEGDSSSRKWVNWINNFSAEIGNLDSLKYQEHKEFLEHTVTEIRVETTDKQTNKLHIEFLTPLVEDSFEWRHPRDKKLGYDINGGKLLKKIDFNVGK
ncbi:hypothetical protein OAD94_06925 [Amylibacter sp.]|nr:hypothetical protein [Amylibacter sp.]